MTPISTRRDELIDAGWGYTDSEWNEAKADDLEEENAALVAENEQLRFKVMAFEAAQDPYRHWSDCSLHNEPAFPAGPCDCRTTQPTHDDDHQTGDTHE